MNQNELETVVRSVLQAQASVTMNLKLATALIERVEEEAARIGVKAVVAVADAGGNPVAIHCMDGAYIGSFDVALNKSYTSVAFQMPTATLGQLAGPGGSLYGIQHTNQGRIVIFGGGDPLYIGERLIGAVGVSGGSAEEDTHLSEYGKNILKEVISCK